MPAKRGYSKKRTLARRGRRRAPYRRKGTRLPIVRVNRPLTMRPISSVQKLVYYNTFKCVPALAEDGSQMLWSIKLLINSPWLFGPNWNSGATVFNQELVPNSPIQPIEVSGYPYNNTTIIPGMREEGGNPYGLYATGTIVGSKTTVTASPIGNSGTDQLQLGYLATRIHSNTNEVPPGTTIDELKKYPFLQLSKLQAGPRTTNNGKQMDARLIVKHSTRRYNNLGDIRDNQQVSFATTPSANDVDSVGKLPNEKDVLSIYLVPALNDLTNPGATSRCKVTNCMMTLRHEVSVMWSEPRSDALNPGNFSFPIPSGYGGGFSNAIAKHLQYMYRR